MNLELDSLPEAGKSDGLLEQLRDDVRSNPDNLTAQIDAICREAARLCQNDDHAEAEALYRKALSACECTPIRIGAPIGFRIYRLLAELLESQDRADEACLNYLTALTLAGNTSAAAGIGFISIAEIHHRLGTLLVSSNELTNAAKHYRQGIALLTQAEPADVEHDLRRSQLHAELEEKLGDLHILLSDYASALGCLSRALQCRRQLSDTEAEDDSAEISQLFEKLGKVFEKLGEVDTAHACMERLQKIKSVPKSL